MLLFGYIYLWDKNALQTALVLVAGCVLTPCQDKKWVYVTLHLTLLFLKGNSGVCVEKELKQWHGK